MEEFGSRIRQARNQLNYSLKTVAKAVEITDSYLSKLENAKNQYPPKEYVIKKLAKVLHLNYQDLIHLACRINRDDKEVFIYLSKKYPEFPLFLKRMKDNPKFARIIFSVLECDIRYCGRFDQY